MKSVPKKLSFALATALGAAAAFAEGWVADPYRAADQAWPKYPVKGRDCWVLLDPKFRELPGVKDMDFIKEAGYYMVRVGTDPLVQSYSRTITVRGLKLLGADGKEVPATAYAFTSDEPGALVQDGAADDGTPFKVLSAPFADVAVRYTAAKGVVRVTAARPFVSVRFDHRTSVGATVAEVAAASAPADVELGAASCRIAFRQPQTEVSFTLISRRPGVRFGTVSGWEGWERDLANAPFTAYSMLGRWGTVGAPADYTDKRALDELAARYPDTFLGMLAGEWDANFMQKLTHGATGYELRDLGRTMKIPCDRNGMVANLKTRWDSLAGQLGSRTYGLSGGITFMHYACDFGSIRAAIETSGERVQKSQRTELLYTASAGRQFGVPFEIYIAYFCGAQHPDSRIMSGQGVDWGMAPSLGTRNYYTGYYMGANYFSFESQPYGQVEEIEVEGQGGGGGKAYRLTANGEAIRDICDWMKRPEGARGEFYAPILVLEDRRAGDDQAWPLAHRKAAFYGLYEATDGDCMNEYLARAVSSPDEHTAPTDPAGGSCHFNSTVGNVVLMYHANPLVHGDVTAAQLAKYPVVIVSGEHVWSEGLANTVKEYVAGGGTLVITAGQSYPFDAAFLGYEVTKGETVSDGLCLANGRVRKGATVLKATADGKPLVVANRYGAGQVDFVTSPFFRRATDAKNRDARYACPPQVRELLEELQDAVLPVKVRGECEFTVNRAPDGGWIYCLVNNLGSVKDPKGTEEKFLAEYARDVTLVLPEGAKAREVRSKSEKVKSAEGANGGMEVTYRVPPAGVLVVKVEGVKLPAAKAAEPKFSPVRNFTRRFALTGVENDGYRYDPAKKASAAKAPALVGEWLAKNGYRDTSGGGHDLRAMKRGKFDYRSTHFKADYPLFNGTIETWVRPADASAFQSDGGRGASGGVLYMNDGAIYLLWSRGRWSLVTMGGGSGRRVDFVGPKAVAGKWTHLCVTFDREVMRLYVDGVEAVGENGVVRSIFGQGKDPFFDAMDIVYGSAQPSWGLPFRGDLDGLRYHSRTFSPAEVKELAAKRW